MCGKVSPAGVKSKKVIVATREKIYAGNIEDAPPRRFGRFRGPQKPRDPGGKGFEIVKELMVCNACAESNEGRAPTVVATAAPEEETYEVTSADE